MNERSDAVAIRDVDVSARIHQQLNDLGVDLAAIAEDTASISAVQPSRLT